MDKLQEANAQYADGLLTFVEFRDKAIYALMEFSEKDCLALSSVLPAAADLATNLKG